MRAFALALLSCAAAAAWAQGLVIPDLRDPALYREPARAGACRVCGEIRSIREVRGDQGGTTPSPERSASGNPNDWAVVGAALYLPTGTGKNENFQVGAVGTPEMVERFGANSYEITIRMDSGEDKVLRRRDGTRFRIGDRVTVSGGMMEKL